METRPQTDMEKLAKYPFLKAAREYVSSLKLNLSGIAGHPLYSASIPLGKERVDQAMRGRIDSRLGDKLSCELSIISYVIARILVNHTGARQLFWRYASAEAENSYFFLREEKPDTVGEVMEDLEVKLTDGRMHFKDYLTLSVNLAKQDPKWKLVNRRMDKGYVSVDEPEVLILVREAIRLKVLEPVDTKSIPDELKKISRDIAVEYVKKPVDVKLDQVKDESIPPCVKAMLASLEAGIISHNERFILATYFIGRGLDLEGLVKVFSRFPNFNEEKTRYQLAFLIGEKSATKYSCPTCAKVKSYGLCKAECGIKHPLNFRG
jgi:DNA primase large subunit